MQWQVISFNRPTFCLFRGNVTVEWREITEVYAEPCQISKMECFKCLAGFWIHLWITALSKEAKWRLKEASKLPFSTDLSMVLIFILFFCNLLQSFISIFFPLRGWGNGVLVNGSFTWDTKSQCQINFSFCFFKNPCKVTSDWIHRCI